MSLMNNANTLGELIVKNKEKFSNKNQTKYPKISIITVCRNAESFIETTILSVINQSYPNIEYIIVDGGSIDNTMPIVHKYEKHITTIISEKDNGVFDAMNKGIISSTGAWLNFMNAGDYFVDNSVLEHIDFTKYVNSALIYGKVRVSGDVKPLLSLKALELGYIPACHQAMFFNTNVIADDLYYTLEFRLYCEYELVNRLYVKKHRFDIIDLLIVDYMTGGISYNFSWQARKAKYILIFRNYGFKSLIRSILYRKKVDKFYL